MNIRALLAAGVIALASGITVGLFAGSLQPPRTRIVRQPIALAHDAGVALQASFNTSTTLANIPARLVGVVGCKQTARLSPRAFSMSCVGHVIGPHGLGDCLSVEGVYYRELGQFARAVTSRMPCPGDANAS